MAFIARIITEAKIGRLTREREYAIANKDYNRVWVLDMQIDNYKNRLVTLTYFT